MMLDHEAVQARLSAYREGDLSDVECEWVEEHLGQCDPCLVELGAIGELVEQAQALPRSIAPPRDLWPEIAARIQADAGAAPHAATTRRVVEGEFRGRHAGRVPVWVLRLAAAVTLVVISSGVTAWVLRPDFPAPTAGRSVDAPPPAEAGAHAGFASAEAAYAGAAENLEAQLNARRHLLSPETIATVEENLRIIDQAIAESSAALEADPSNAELPLILSGVYRQKVQLLRTAVQLAQNS